jgi:hypothetical protein
MLVSTAPAWMPWLWPLDHLQGREPTHGFEATREAAMQAFAKSWHRD